MQVCPALESACQFGMNLHCIGERMVIFWKYAKPCVAGGAYHLGKGK